jgi:hypothetical protein
LNANSDNEVSAQFDDGGVNDKAKSLAEVINLISDVKSLLIFKTGDSSEILRAQLKLTRNQYYSRVSHKSWFSEKTKREIFCYCIW